MRAALLDQQGPMRARLLRAAAVLAPAVAYGVLSDGFFWPLFHGLMLMGLFRGQQRRPRPVELVLGAGYVDVKGGRLGQRIRARDIFGGSSARTSRGVALTLAHRKRMSPIVIELESEAQADEVRRALGIGHEGFGILGWFPEWTPAGRFGLVGRILWLVGIAAMLASSSDAAIIVGMLMFMVMFLILPDLFDSGAAAFAPVRLDALGVHVGPRFLPYGAVRDVIVEKGRIAVVAHDGTILGTERSRFAHGGAGMPDVAAEVFAAQVRSAAARAQGLGKPKDDRTARIESLRRSGGESYRDWLVRLDATARMLSTGAGYRGSTLDVADLWSVLDDPNAEPQLRVAAARILRMSGQPEAKVRIDAAAEAAHDEREGRRLRVALDEDVDHATAELAQIELGRT